MGVDIGRNIKDWGLFGAVVGGIGVGLAYLWGKYVPPVSVMFASVPHNIDVRTQVITAQNSGVVNKLFQLLGGINLQVPDMLLIVVSSAIAVVAGKTLFDFLTTLMPVEKYGINTPLRKMSAILLLSGLAGAAFINGLIIKSWPWETFVAMAIYAGIVAVVVSFGYRVLNLKTPPM